MATENRVRNTKTAASICAAELLSETSRKCKRNVTLATLANLLSCAFACQATIFIIILLTWVQFYQNIALTGTKLRQQTFLATSFCLWVTFPAFDVRSNESTLRNAFYLFTAIMGLCYYPLIDGISLSPWVVVGNCSEPIDVRHQLPLQGLGINRRTKLRRTPISAI